MNCCARLRARRGTDKQALMLVERQNKSPGTWVPGLGKANYRFYYFGENGCGEEFFFATTSAGFGSPATARLSASLVAA